jgi:hypothetical protein
MKIAILSLLLSFIFLLPARGLAQQSKYPAAGLVLQNLATQRPVQPGKMGRMNAVFEVVRNAFKEFCGKNGNHPVCKSEATEEEAINKLVQTNPQLLTYINTGSIPDLCRKGRKEFCGESVGEAQPQRIVGTSSPADSVDTPSSDAGAAAGQPSIDQVEILSLSCDALGRTILRAVDPKLDVDFPGRGDWENDLCRDREQWKMQYDRYVAHKGTATEAHERELAADAYQLLQTRSWEGPALARRFINGEK